MFPRQRIVVSALLSGFLLLLAAAAGAGEPAGRSGGVTVLDEACVDRRTEMCLRIAQGRGTAVLQSSPEEACSVLICERGWHKWETGHYGRLGPLCECHRRVLPIAPGELCAEGLREIPVTGSDGAARPACELADLTREIFPGVRWPTTPFDLMSCLQFARSGPGSGACRVAVPAAAR